jgi:hypothetical protein
MDFVKIIYEKDSYNYHEASSMRLCTLGLFLADDVGGRISSIREWFFDDNVLYASMNITGISKEKGCVLLNDLYFEEKPSELKLTYSQFLQLLDDWEEKVLKLKPKEVTIKYENDQFIFETED